MQYIRVVVRLAFPVRLRYIIHLTSDNISTPVENFRANVSLQTNKYKFIPWCILQGISKIGQNHPTDLWSESHTLNSFTQSISQAAAADTPVILNISKSAEYAGLSIPRLACYESRTSCEIKLDCSESTCSGIYEMSIIYVNPRAFRT